MRSRPEHAGPQPAHAMRPDRRKHRSLCYTPSRENRPLLIHDLATAHFVQRREDALFLEPPGTGKSHLAQAIGRAAIRQCYRVVDREAHTLTSPRSTPTCVRDENMRLSS